MKKCPHGVMITAWSPDPERAPYCSGCFSVAEVDKLADNRVLYFPKGHDHCPKCGSDRFHYENDWCFKCFNCNANELTVRGLDDEYKR
jgi:hypothetical protein